MPNILPNFSPQIKDNRRITRKKEKTILLVLVVAGIIYVFFVGFNIYQNLKGMKNNFQNYENNMEKINS